MHINFQITTASNIRGGGGELERLGGGGGKLGSLGELPLPPLPPPPPPLDRTDLLTSHEAKGETGVSLRHDKSS